ncbi:MAG: ZIP family metal transporter [Candidatus Aenigmarchaeota archaeon]|nr:ZIP family metal transporter [Candidatus Aenigmarchaeota archaeon]
MVDPVLMSLASVAVVSLVSFIGVITLVVNDRMIRNILPLLVGFSAGALLGDAFIHLIPEAAEGGFSASISLYILLGIVVSFIVEKIVHWKHKHTLAPASRPQPFAYMNLFGDAIHNFIDGAVVAASYLVSVPIGIATTIAVVFHEIPQEIGDFGVLLHGGFSRKKALFWNFISALFAVFGAVVSIFISTYIESSLPVMVAFAAGGFVYIAGADLIPELHKKNDIRNSIIQFLSITLGIATMYLLVFIE